MDPRTLTVDELAALIALLQNAVLADRIVSTEEKTYVRGMSLEFDHHVYQRALALANERLRSQQANLVPLIEKVERQEAREVIYQLVVQTAACDGIDPRELQILGWLETRWGLERPPEVAVGAVLQPTDD